MNSVNEKEKKLISALSELKNLKLHNPEIKQHLEALSTQKNQLEIEKEDKIEQKKQMEFSEKIDELNQETDTLIEEIDKWQM
jgi:5-formyltetrahydrofolate cyclo-ligase